MNDSALVAAPSRPTCAACGTAFPAAMLSCPHCQRLVHADTLKQLGEQARAQAAAGEQAAELTTWRSMLALLPEGSRQQAQVRSRIEQLTTSGVKPQAAPSTSPAPQHMGGKLAGLGALALLVWKFKAVIAFALTKGKLLLLGLTKMHTLLSMFLSLGLYWSLWGWWFALGFVLNIYVHEMGHVAALRRLGIAASAPMFIPGFGAFVRLKEYPATVAEDAEVGLAGPVWGLGAALACYGVFAATDVPIWAALARTGGWINLFNLLPVWQLDGGRGFRALDRRQRWLAAGVIGAAWFLTGENLLLLLGLVAALAAAFGQPAERPHPRAFYTYSVLIAVLAWLAALKVPAS